jgi:hypothetical protein
MPKPQNFTADFADRTQKEGANLKFNTLAIGSAMQKQWPVAVQ